VTVVATPVVEIAAELQEASAQKLALGIVVASVAVTDRDADLWSEIDTCIAGLHPIDDISSLNEVQALRTTYKALGKDPSRYRGSNEALLRRVGQGKGLYRINTVVDINNLISLESRRSVASYDRDKIGDRIVFRRGQTGERYQAIGKGVINLDGLPVFADENGPFGSTTSDSERAMITAQTQRVMMVIISFDGEDRLESQLARACALLERYARARNLARGLVL
jgi:DNA/RNA-binding domain of Phe-tRNA-synthetase-like protein